MNDEEITRYSIGFILAGYETTAMHSLMYYMLALYPNVQEKLYTGRDRQTTTG